jgi:hypothetical protein
MTRASTSERWVRRGGVVFGVALVCAVLVAFRVPGGSGRLGTDLIVSISPTGELGVDRAGPFVTATGLGPGSSADGGFRVANQTGKVLAVRLRALPDSRELDRVLAVEVWAGTARVFKGRLGALRAGTGAFAIAPGDRRAVRVRAQLPSGLQRGWAGRISTVKLELSSVIVEARHG